MGSSWQPKIYARNTFFSSVHKNITREQNKKMKVQKTSKEISKEKLQGKPAKRRKKENNPQPMYNIEKEDDNQQVTTSK